jgi:hypothetical protein
MEQATVRHLVINGLATVASWDHLFLAGAWELGCVVCVAVAVWQGCVRAAMIMYGRRASADGWIDGVHLVPVEALGRRACGGRRGNQKPVCVNECVPAWGVRKAMLCKRFEYVQHSHTIIRSQATRVRGLMGRRQGVTRCEINYRCGTRHDRLLMLVCASTRNGWSSNGSGDFSSAVYVCTNLRLGTGQTNKAKTNLWVDAGAERGRQGPVLVGFVALLRVCTYAGPCMCVSIAFMPLP